MGEGWKWFISSFGCAVSVQWKTILCDIVGGADVGQSDSRDPINLHVSHRIVALSANHVLFVECGRVHGAQ